ncbi:Hsp70 family protein [Dactylosporangium sp. NPDC051484]|uniref:Hsp70 family protein n=1 Tax=Dactylosporangium sp. NPDC051484 TaxID=3154942 RepID=UPI00345012BE
MGPTPTHRLAIDLGTCHTVAVVHRGEEAPRALLFDGSPVMPSGIYADEHGRLTVGRDAERLSQLAPERFEPYPKRSVDAGSVLLGQAEVTVVEMLASLLRRAAEESLQAGVNPVGSTVLTCPADWGGQRRGVLLEAARAANLGPVVLVDEPIAAATYCLRVLGHQVAPLQSLAVFDFGGGTLDVSVVRREFDGLRVLGLGGLDDLGGVDVDAALVGHLGQLIHLRNPELWQRLSNPDSTAAHRDRRELWSEVRAAKEMLSRAASAPVHLPGTDEALHLTREELDRVAGPLIDRAVDETRRVLERAGVDVRQLAGIFLVGGSSRIPLVASRLHARFGVAPVVPEQPELPVAYGGMLAVGASPQQQFNAPPVPRPRPGSGAPISPSAFAPSPPYPPSGSIPVSAVPGGPTSPGAYGSPVGPASSMASTTFPVAPASPGVAPGGPPPLSPQRPVSPPAPPGLAQPGMPQPGMPQPGMAQAGMAAPAMAPPAYGPTPPVVRPRRRTGPWIALVVVLAIIGSCVWGGNKIFNWVGDQVQSVRDGLPGGSGDSGSGKVDGLDVGTPISLASGGKVTAVAGKGMVFTAVVSSGKVDVDAYAVTGDKRWTANVPMEPEDLSLRVVGDLLLVDGERDTQRDGVDARSVLSIGDGAIKWTDKWPDKLDLFYVGTDAITEVRARDTAVQRVDLLTGATRWSHKGKGGFITSGNRLVHPSLVWPGEKRSGALVPSYQIGFQQRIPFQESIDVDPGVVVQMQSEGKAGVIDLSNGALKANGSVASAGDLPWLVYGGMAIFKKKDAENSIVAYRLSDFGQAWEYKTTAGVKIEDFRPCGEKLICIKAKQSSYTLIAIGMDDGQLKWTKPQQREPNWYVLDDKLVLGRGTFTSVENPTVSDPANGNDKYALGGPLSSKNAYAGAGGRVAMVTIHVSGFSSMWQVAVVGTADGKIVGSADYDKDNILTDVSMSADTVVLIDEKNRKIYRYGIPGPK